MYVSVSHLRIDPNLAADLIDAFRGRIRLVEAHDGFIDLQVWQSETDRGEIMMVSRWESRAAFTDYMKSTDHAVSHDRIDPALQGAIRLEKLEHVSGYEVVAE
jgi:heme-degrading monooxygenase HmoA